MAQAAKEKGNAAFKVGDFPAAVGHYSAAIHADRTDFTLPLNRAAAYLKLGKNEDAERDCGTVLALNKGNVKALFRRAQARAALGKLVEAQADLNEGAALEPANQSVKQELSRVAGLLQTKKAKPKTVPVDVSAAPKRRRVPITVIEADGRRYPAGDAASGSALRSAAPTKTLTATKTKPDVAANAEPVMSAVSSRALNAPSTSSNATTPGPSSTPVSSFSSSPAPTTPPKETANEKEKEKPKPASFKDAKSARESKGRGTGTVGGGIFRASGESVLFKPRGGKDADVGTGAGRREDGSASTPAPKAAPSPPAPPPPTKHSPEPSNSSNPETEQEMQPVKSPMTLFDFTRAWERAGTANERYAVLCRIPPGAFPSLFQMSLEPAMFVEIVDALGAVLAAPDADASSNVAAAYLHAFARVPRFATVARFLSAGERARVREVWAELGVEIHNEDKKLPPQLGEVWGAVYR